MNHAGSAARAPDARPERSNLDSGARCMVCGEATGRVASRKLAYEIKKCPCGGVYLDPPPPAGAVDPTVDLHPAGFYEWPADLKVRWLQRSHRSGALLEVGCGEGYFLDAARRRGFDIAGIEPHDRRATLARARLGIPILQSLVEEDSWPAASCDVVYHCDLLSHFPDPVRALRSMVRLLRRGGVLFFEVGLDGGLPDSWYRRMPVINFPNHRWFFSPAALHRLLADSKLRILRERRFHLGFQTMVYDVLSRALDGIRGSRRTGPDLVDDSRGNRRDGFFRAWYHGFMRYRVGSVAPAFGPTTALIIAAPEG